MISKCKKCRTELPIEGDEEVYGLWCEECATKEFKRRREGGTHTVKSRPSNPEGEQR